MRSAGASFVHNASIDSNISRPLPDHSPSFERCMEEFSHNCDVLLDELVSFSLPAQIGVVMLRDLIHHLYFYTDDV